MTTNLSCAGHCAATAGLRTLPRGGAEVQAGAMTLHDFNALVRAAGLAPSLHNMQPWRFETTENTLRVYADRSARPPPSILRADGCSWAAARRRTTRL